MLYMAADVLVMSFEGCLTGLPTGDFVMVMVIKYGVW